MCFSLKGKQVVSSYMHWHYISCGSLDRFRTLGAAAELFELSQKNPFSTGCGHRNYVNFSTLMSLMSGRGYIM